MSFMFLFAGFDTVASAASFMVYHLATRPEIQEKLRDEIEQVCGSQVYFALVLIT
jgi:cytochrome P450 family 9